MMPLPVTTPSLALLLILSLSSAFPVGEEVLLPPGLDIGPLTGVSIENVGGILDMLIQSGGTVKNVIDKFNNVSNVEAVQALVEEAEEIIVRLQQGVGEINEQHKTFAGEALKEMLHIKLQLRNSRLSLNELAKRTVFAVDDLKAFSEAMFADDTEEGSGSNLDLANTVDLRNTEKMVYVKEQMTVMKNLIVDTKAKVDEVKKIYSDIKLRMTSVEENLINYKLMVGHLLRNETNEGGSHASKARAAVYSSAGVSTTVCIVADVLGAMGICSGINAAAVATSAITLEVALANMRANLETLQRDGKLVIADVQALMRNQGEIEDYLYEEEQVLAYWVAALEVVDRKVANPSRLFFLTLPVIKMRYLQSLQDLGQAAQDYLDQKEL